VVEDLLVAVAVAAARLRQHVRRVGHGFHAAGHHHGGVARDQLVVGHHRGLHARAAHLVHRGGGRGIVEPRLERRLARGGLALPGWEHAAHDEVVDFLRADACLLEGGLDGHGAELVGGERVELALHGADGGALAPTMTMDSGMMFPSFAV